MRTKGSASEAGVDFTTHSSARTMIWMKVKRCILQVFTCGTKSPAESGWWVQHPTPFPRCWVLRGRQNQCPKEPSEGQH